MAPVRIVLAALLFTVGLALSGGAQAQYSPARFANSWWNLSSDPDALYGHCGYQSSMGSKRGQLPYVGESVNDVLAIRVLLCKQWTFGPGWHKVDCPEGSAYDFCMNAVNDGRGNDVTLAVLKASARTDPTAKIDGCPAGARTQARYRLVQAADRDPRTVKGIVTLLCGPATVTERQRPRLVECPGERNPFDYCLSTGNDGLGNAVTIGVVRTHASGDPQGLYGECDQEIDPGFATKVSLLTALGLPTERVRAIDVLGCAVPWGIGGNLPKRVHAVPCTDAQAWLPAELLERYDYCLIGTDARNNGILMGVSGR